MDSEWTSLQLATGSDDHGTQNKAGDGRDRQNDCPHVSSQDNITDCSSHEDRETVRDGKNSLPGVLHCRR